MFEQRMLIIGLVLGAVAICMTIATFSRLLKRNAAAGTAQLANEEQKSDDDD